MTPQLLERLRSAPSYERSYNICAAVGSGYLAKSPAAKGALLIPCSRGDSTLGRAFGALLLKFKPEIQFSVDGSEWTAPAAVIECLEDSLLPTFVALAQDVTSNVGRDGSATPEVVLRALGHWELLLRSRALLSEEAQLGLWGELAFLLGLPSVDAGLRAWAPGPRDPLDFIANQIGIEVKSGVARLKHSISLSQAASADGHLRLFFASLWVIPDPTGRTLREMVDRVEGCSAERTLLEQKLLATGYSRVHAEAYGRRFALGAPVTLFPAAAIPRVREWDAGVTSIRFTVELDQEAALDETSCGQVLAEFSS